MDAVDAALAAVRAAHFGATLLLFGQLAYVLAVSPGRRPGPELSRIAGWCLCTAFVTALAWLLLEAMHMSGLPAAQALGADTVSTVLAQTQFGKVMLFRLATGAALAVLLFRPAAAAPGAAAGGLAGALLAALALTGHAADARGAEGAVRLLSDTAHLVAAGAWLGALVPLALVLRRALRGDETSRGEIPRVLARFSMLGIACMALILVSGVVNAWYTVGSVAALTQTQYGRLLALKVLLFWAILVLAAINRAILTPRIVARRDQEGAMSALIRNTLLELGLGLGVVAVVGLLGITAPASHALAAGPAHEGHEAHEHASTPAAGYTPGLGEIMTLQQMRHAKLWFAGAARNWELADYELDELREGFDDVARLRPMHEGVPVGEMAGKLTAGPLQALDEAVKKKDAAAFARSFDQLTAACNSCHRAAQHGFIRIQRPAAPPVSNQVFSPAK